MLSRGVSCLWPVPHVLIIHLFFIPFSATNCLQKYKFFKKHGHFAKKTIKNIENIK